MIHSELTLLKSLFSISLSRSWTESCVVNQWFWFHNFFKDLVWIILNCLSWNARFNFLQIAGFESIVLLCRFETNHLFWISGFDSVVFQHPVWNWFVYVNWFIMLALHHSLGVICFEWDVLKGLFWSWITALNCWISGSDSVIFSLF